MFDVSSDSTATAALERLAALGVDPSDPAVRQDLLAIAQEAAKEQKDARQKALEAIADNVKAAGGVPWVSKSSGNPGTHLRWTALADGRRIEVRVLDAKKAE
jgi:hypothetical protein